MKVLILGFGKIAYMPYMHIYIDILKKNNCDIHLLYWDRDGKEDTMVPEGVTPYKFEYHQEDDVSKWKKLKPFYGYRKKAQKIIKNGEFDTIIVLHSLPGLLVYDVLNKKYHKNYILDYRDVTFENIGIFKQMVHKLINSSKATFVSSDAFRIYMPDADNIYTSHNLLTDSLNNRDVRRCTSRTSSPLRIRYWGLIRHEEINKKIISKLANDSRFELHYHGREQETTANLKRFCSEHDIKNVFFHGVYKPIERYNFAGNTDLIHNIYENDTKTINAMGNKFYDGVTLYLPQLCSTGSFMGKQVTKNKIGLECDPDKPSFADDIINYYSLILWNEFETNCDIKLAEIIKEINTQEDIITKAITNDDTI